MTNSLPASSTERIFDLYVALPPELIDKMFMETFDFCRFNKFEFEKDQKPRSWLSLVIVRRCDRCFCC